MNTHRITVAVAAVLAAGVHAASQTTTPALTIATLSSRPDMVSGGDALVEIRMGTTPPEGVVVRLNNQDVTKVFRSDASRGSLVGLLEGLRVGRNALVAIAGTRSAKLEITNFPVIGPILSGPHLTPYLCRTEENGLGPPLDENCSAARKVEYFYRSTETASPQQPAASPLAPPPGFKPLPDPAGPRPADLARTTTSDGRAVPYIVRVESGTINRGVYRIAILDDPGPSGSGAWRPGPAWNGRLVASFGGGCGVSYHQGVAPMAQTLFDVTLSRGYANVVSTQTVYGVHCNDHLSGEALMMIKEHFTERYGVPKWTMGFGSSGGAIQQLLIAQNFPGLLDGLVLGATFADSPTVRLSTTDCRLLINFYKTDAVTWTPEKQTAVEGYSPGTCGAWDRSFVNNIVADYAQGCGLPADLVYHPATNPKGARCTTWDISAASFGRNPATGFARRTVDNVGVQYGLLALNSGAITKTEFLDLNQKIGGFDDDGHLRAERTVADAEGVRLAYAAGRVNSGANLDAVPMLQFRRYQDAVGDIHSRERDFAVRERLTKAKGRFGNHVLWQFPAPGTGAFAAPGVAVAMVVDTMDEWLDALARDPMAGTAYDRIVRAKPAAAVDACWDANATKIEEAASIAGGGKCNTLYPAHRNPRLVAGAPLADDILKCQLKPIDLREYRVTFTPDEVARLRQIFPGGVCDYGKPGVSQQPPAGTYQRLPIK
jgi:hypothetical protein